MMPKIPPGARRAYMERQELRNREDAARRAAGLSVHSYPSTTSS
jgi:hypothetical protein